jgi:putative peptidoglycan lipid II flippase
MSIRQVARAAAVVALFGILSRVLGFVREIVLAGVYGATAQTDALVNALFVVNTVAAVLLYVLVTLMIPVFQQERERAGAQSAWALLWAIVGWIGMGLIVLTGLVAIVPEAFVWFFQMGPERAAIASELLRVMAPALMLQGFSALFTAILQVHGRFAGPAAVGVAFNAGILVGVILGAGTLGITAAAWGVSLGALLQVLLQLPQFIRESRAGGGMRVAFTHPRLGSVAVLAIPVAAASILQQVNSFTDKLFASSLEAGRNAALSFANALGSAPRTVLLFPLLVPLFPLIARFFAEQRKEEGVDAFRRAAGILALVSVPLSILIAIGATEIAQVAFGRGKCDATCVAEISAPLAFYGIAVWGNFIGYLLNRTLSAGNHAREIMMATIITVVLTIGLDLLLLRPLEQAGLALASAIAVYVNTGITLWFLRRRTPQLSLRALATQQGRILIAGVVAGAVALVPAFLVPGGAGSFWGAAAWLAIVSAVGGAVFVLMARALAPREFADARLSLSNLSFARRR